MKTDEREIKNLGDVLLTSDEIIDFRTSALTKPGDNFGSEVLKVEVKTKNAKNEENTLHVIAKLLHPNEVIQEIFNCQISFKNEIAFYKTIVPTLVEFRNKNGMGDFECFPKFYGGRFNVDGSDKVDMDAALLLENLKIEDYDLCNKMEGFDLRTTRLILKNLANFHATGLALKQLDRKTFEDKIKPHLGGIAMAEKDTERFCNNIINVITEDETYSIYKDRLKAQLLNPDRAEEPWACLRHSDLWVNNIMVKPGEETKVKFVDFQIVDYKSPIGDLVFFLFSSVSEQLLSRHLDEFLDYYHKEFINTLEKFGCETTQFCKTEFEKELKFVVKYCELRHILMMCFIVFADKKTLEIMEEGEKNGEKNEEMVPYYSDFAKDRMKYVTKVFAERGWLE